MKYVGLKEFMKLPEGTLYMIEEDPDNPLCGFSRPICIKYENTGNLDNDWAEADLVDLGIGDELVTNYYAMRDGDDVSLMEPSAGRYGLYPKEGEIRFWILTKEDHEFLISVLQQALQSQG